MHGSLRAVVAVTALWAGTAAAQDLPFAPGEDPRFDWAGYEAFAADHDLAGETLTITGPWTGVDGERMAAMLVYFAEATGARVAYSGSESFEQDIVIGVQSDSPPDVAVFPRPGLARDMAARGALAPLDPAVADWVRASHAAGDSWADLATFEGPDGQQRLFGLFFGAEVKSLVWYSPGRFAAEGHAPPRSMDELRALNERIAAGGGAPWCLGVAARGGAPAGALAADWVEEMMLRTQPAEVYDAWASNAIPFDDARVAAAIDAFGWFARDDAFVDGGAGAAAEMTPAEAARGLLGDAPRCHMVRGGASLAAAFPEDAEVGFFYLPADADAGLGRPVLGDAALVAVVVDGPAAQAFVRWLMTPFAHEIRMALGGFVTPLEAARPEAYAGDDERALGAILRDATTFRVDASDLMPREIGAEAFPEGMLDYLAGADAAGVAAAIQDRWSAIR